MSAMLDLSFEVFSLRWSYVLTTVVHDACVDDLGLGTTIYIYI